MFLGLVRNILPVGFLVSVLRLFFCRSRCLRRRSLQERNLGTCSVLQCTHILLGIRHQTRKLRLWGLGLRTNHLGNQSLARRIVQVHTCRLPFRSGLHRRWSRHCNKSHSYKSHNLCWWFRHRWELPKLRLGRLCRQAVVQSKQITLKRVINSIESTPGQATF